MHVTSEDHRCHRLGNGKYHHRHRQENTLTRNWGGERRRSAHRKRQEAREESWKLYSISDIGDENKLHSLDLRSPITTCSSFFIVLHIVGLPPGELILLQYPFLPPLLWWTSIQFCFRMRAINLLWIHCTKKLFLTSLSSWNKTPSQDANPFLF